LGIGGFKNSEKDNWLLIKHKDAYATVEEKTVKPKSSVKKSS